MIYYVVIKIIVHLNDFLGNYRFIMQISDLLRIMRQLIDLQEKKKGERKDNLWYRL